MSYKQAQTEIILGGLLAIDNFNILARGLPPLAPAFEASILAYALVLEHELISESALLELATTKYGTEGADDVSQKLDGLHVLISGWITRAKKESAT